MNPHLIQHKLVRNPNYSGEAVGPFGWRAVPLEPAPNKAGFHAAMEQSVREEGVRNPSVVYRFGGKYYLSFGGSRVFAARKVGILLPCIVNDHDDAFNFSNVTPENWQDYFKDVPAYHEFNEHGFDYHYHIEKNRRASYDEAGMRWVEPLSNTDFLQEEFPWIER
jgi:hypothetical protein